MHCTKVKFEWKELFLKVKLYVIINSLVPLQLNLLKYIFSYRTLLTVQVQSVGNSAEKQRVVGSSPTADIPYKVFWW